MWHYGILAFLLASCGQSSAFDENKTGESTAGTESGSSSKGNSTSGSDSLEGEAVDDSDVVGGKNTDPDSVLFPPSINTEESGALKTCLSRWKEFPFDGPVSVRKIVAISINSIGPTVDDRRATTQPELVLIRAGINVGSKIEYNLLNPNAYYCVMNNVNVKTELTVNLHCNARLADTQLAIDINSQGDRIAERGVNIDSTVELVDIRPDGSRCIR